jgi:uncharacterized protein (TIGR03083 family)
MHDQEIIVNLERVWGSLDSLCTPFTERDWKLPTDLPGWSVQDNIAHIIDFESRFLGRPVPDHTPKHLPHMKNELGHRNEIWVDWYRSHSGAQVLVDFRAVTSERLGVLRAMRDEDFAAPSPVALRPESLRGHLQRRIVDCWAHEQDIRRAVRRPGHYDGPVVAHVLGRLSDALPMVVAKKVEAPEGTIVVVALTGAGQRTLALCVEGERAVWLDALPAQPTVHLSMTTETFACLVLGRWVADATLQDGRVQLAGDTALGQAIVTQMNITP